MIKKSPCTHNYIIILIIIIIFYLTKYILYYPANVNVLMFIGNSINDVII